MTTPAQRLEFPDLDALGMAWPTLKKAISEWRALWARYEHAATREDELIRTRPDHVERDRTALASALRQGKPDPGQRDLEAHDTQIAEARRQRDALAIAVETAAAELGQLVERNRARWQDDVAARLEDDRAALRDAVEAWAAARRRLSEHRSLAVWVDGFPARSVYKISTPSVAGLIGLSGNGQRFDQVRTALLAEAESADPEPVQAAS